MKEYKDFTYKELIECERGIDKEKNPERYNGILKFIEIKEDELRKTRFQDMDKFSAEYLKYMYFNTFGRIGRFTFFISLTVFPLVILLFGVLFFLLFSIFDKTLVAIFGGLFLVVLPYFLFYTLSAVILKRMHDLEMGWKYLISLIIPFWNIFVIALLFIKKGKEGENYYGIDPLS